MWRVRYNLGYTFVCMKVQMALQFHIVCVPAPMRWFIFSPACPNGYIYIVQRAKSALRVLRKITSSTVHGELEVISTRRASRDGARRIPQRKKESASVRVRAFLAGKKGKGKTTLFVAFLSLFCRLALFVSSRLCSALAGFVRAKGHDADDDDDDDGLRASCASPFTKSRTRTERWRWREFITGTHSHHCKARTTNYQLPIRVVSLCRGL